MNNQVTTVANAGISNGEKKSTFSLFMQKDDVRNMINNVVGKNASRFITSIVSAVSANPDLQQCEQWSILSCALLGAGLELTPSPQLGQYYIIPFKDNKTGVKKAQFVLGYKGYIQLAIRSGYYKKMSVLAIKEGELIKYDPLCEEIEVNLIEDDEKRENAKTVGYYAMFEYVNGFRKIIYWTKAKMERHALLYSKGYASKKGYTFWEKDFDSMAFKTMLRQLISKWGIMSVDMQNALDADAKIVDNGGALIEVGGIENETNEAISAPIVDSNDNMNDNSQDSDNNSVEGVFGNATLL